MMKKSVLHYVADDPDGVFAYNYYEKAQFEMLFSLISDYHVDEDITTADQHGNHVRYLFLFLLIIILIFMIIIIIIDHDDRDNHIYHSLLPLIIISDNRY